MRSGPQPPARGLFQYPENTDNSVPRAIRYLKHRGLFGCRRSLTTSLRSQVAAIGGGSASVSKTLGHTLIRRCCHTTEGSCFHTVQFRKFRLLKVLGFFFFVLTEELSSCLKKLHSSLVLRGSNWICS